MEVTPCRQHAESAPSAVVVCTKSYMQHPRAEMEPAAICCRALCLSRVFAPGNSAGVHTAAATFLSFFFLFFLDLLFRLVASSFTISSSSTCSHHPGFICEFLLVGSLLHDVHSRHTTSVITQNCTKFRCNRGNTGRTFLSVSSFCVGTAVVTRSEPLGISSTVALNCATCVFGRKPADRKSVLMVLQIHGVCACLSEK